jgi:hypothetical protein
VIDSNPQRAASARKKPARRSIALQAVLWGLKALFATFVILTPLVGAWTASSLAAYANGPVWLVALTGFLLFPIGPGLWEAISEIRYRRRTAAARILTRGDRLLLRTLAINLLFLGILWFSGPRAAFRALSARGDWMLDGSKSSGAERVRSFLFRVANGLEFAYGATHKPTWTEDGKGDTKKQGDRPAPMPRADETRKRGGDEPTPTNVEPEPEPPKPFDSSKPWPSAAKSEAILDLMKPDDEASVAAIASFVRDHESDPFLRFKALHDWVALHVEYDVPALTTRQFPPQDAGSILRARKAVCAGYSHLLKALGDAAGYHVEFVTGVAKGAGGEVDGLGHAWNAVEIEGNWYLVDSTWDAGSVGPSADDPEPHFQREYRTEYLFTPGDVFVNDHFPELAKWELVTPALTRGEFMRRPQLRPAFYAQGLKLVSPDRSQVTVSGSVDLVIDHDSSDGNLFLLADVRDQAGGRITDCSVTRQASFAIHCPLNTSGDFRVVLFSSRAQYSTYSSVGELDVLNR